MNPLAEAGKGGGIGVVAVILQPTGDPLPAPSSQPGATDQHVSRHLQNLLVSMLLGDPRKLVQLAPTWDLSGHQRFYPSAFLREPVYTLGVMGG